MRNATSSQRAGAESVRIAEALDGVGVPTSASGSGGRFASTAAKAVTPGMTSRTITRGRADHSGLCNIIYYMAMNSPSNPPPDPGSG